MVIASTLFKMSPYTPPGNCLWMRFSDNFNLSWCRQVHTIQITEKMTYDIGKTCPADRGCGNILCKYNCLRGLFGDLFYSFLITSLYWFSVRLVTFSLASSGSLLFRCLCHKDCFKIELNPQYIKWRSYYGLLSKEMQLTVGPMEHLFEHLRKVCQGGQLTDNMLLHVLVFSK
jgi:hypothetical protein